MKLNCILILFLAFSVTEGQSPKEILKRIQNKFTSINNFSAGFNQTIFTGGTANGIKSSGKFLYKKKNKFIVDLKKQSIYSDGETVWNIDAKFNRVVVSSLRDDPTTFSLEKFVFDYPPLCRAKIIKDETTKPGEYLLELTPKDNDLQFKSIKIWSSPESFISKMELIDIADMKYIFEFTDLVFNQDLADNKFIFYPPKGMQVIDIR